MPLPTVLGNTSVTLNRVAAPLFSVSSSQSFAPASVQVIEGVSQSAAEAITVTTAAPGIFIVGQSTNMGAILHAGNYSFSDWR